MLLRKGRLGGIDSDVLEFITSREADAWITQADLDVDRAHLVMLQEQGLIGPQERGLIWQAISEIEADPNLLGEGEDVHEAIEAYVIARAGPSGGRMHTGRSRNDEVATCIRLALRGQMLGLFDELLSLESTLVELAARHAADLVPGFTHLQHAQPTTLGHHLLAHADALHRDCQRLEDAYSRINRSPLGAAAFASTGFPIDRDRTAELLGFDGLVENSMDAVSSRDFLLETLCALSIMMVNLSRMAEEVILWSTQEFGYLEIDDLFASTSSIMPQKKNPDTAELVRGKTGSVIGCLVSALATAKALPMSYNRDLQEITPNLWRAVSIARSALRIMDGCYQSLRFSLARLEESAGAGFSTATELADSLVRVTGIPFRTAHQIVGRLAAAGQAPNPDDLDRAGQEVAKVKPSQMGYSADMLRHALDPHGNVAVRNRPGGPAPSEVRRMVRRRRSLIRQAQKRSDQRREKAEGALQRLRKTA